ncbi:MAG: hypothetical protein QM768_18530 [Agriterribacter sp.]
MKFILCLSFLSSAIACFSQNENFVLFNQGAVLEYQTYLPRTGIFGKHKGYFETTRLTYTITNTTRDSASGAKKALITKYGVPYAETKRDLHWQTQMNLELDNGIVKFPPIFYYPDTVYLCDVYKIHGPREKVVYSASKMEEGGTTNYSLNENNYVNIENEQYKISSFIKDPEGAEVAAFASGSHADYSGAKTIVRMRTISSINEGKTKVSVAAGTFACDKIVKTIEITVYKRARIVKIIYYISPQVGLVKTESLDGDLLSGYTELIRVKKGRNNN